MTPEQKRIQELEAKLHQMELKHAREMQEAQSKIGDLQSQVLFLQNCSGSIVNVIVEGLLILQNKYPSDAQFQKELWEKITSNTDKAATNLSKEKFFKRLFKKGNERLSIRPRLKRSKRPMSASISSSR